MPDYNIKDSNHEKILFIAASLVISSQVQAAPGCKASDLNGNYVMYQAAINKNFHTGRCEIQILNGNATGTCAFDPLVDLTPNFNGPVSGPAVMNKNCSASLELAFNPNLRLQTLPSCLLLIFNLRLTSNRSSVSLLILLTLKAPPVAHVIHRYCQKPQLINS